jgi:hypothetical protein
MGSTDVDNDRRIALARRIPEIDRALDEQYASWEQWSLEIEQGVSPDATATE